MPSHEIFPPLNSIQENGPQKAAWALRMKQQALDELCAPTTPPSIEETYKIEAFREHYKSAVKV